MNHLHSQLPVLPIRIRRIALRTLQSTLQGSCKVVVRCSSRCILVQGSVLKEQNPEVLKYSMGELVDVRISKFDYNQRRVFGSIEE